jgi:hypothetical protein
MASTTNRFFQGLMLSSKVNDQGRPTRFQFLYPESVQNTVFH